MRMPGPTTRDPLRPLEGIVGFLLGIFLIPLVIVVPFALFGIGSLNFSYFGGDSACVVTPSSTFPTSSGASIQPGSNYGGAIGLRRGTGATAKAESIRVCNRHPTRRDTWTASLAELTPPLFALAAFAFLYLLLRAARRRGVFSALTAKRTWMLGWFLLIGSVLAELFRQAMIGATLSGIVQHETWRSLLAHPQFSVSLIVTGIGLICVGHVLAQAVVLREEQDATI